MRQEDIWRGVEEFGKSYKQALNHVSNLFFIFNKLEKI